MTKHDIDLLTRQLLNIGEAMYYAGAEISRIEDTLHRVGKAYGADHVAVYAITSSIVVTMEFPEQTAITQSRRIRRDSTDLTKLEHLNDLCRKCVEAPMPVEELRDEVLKILDEKPSNKLLLLGEVLGASAFAIFFGGSLWDGIAAALGACFIFLMQQYLLPLCKSQVFFNILVSFLTGVLVSLAAKGLTVLNADKIIIGDIMVLIPGIAITNSMRYTISGDSISGLEKLVDSLLQAMGIAAGFTLSMLLFR